jgi:hypothetical protein
MDQTTPFGDMEPLVWHNGLLPGYQSELWMVPGEQFAAVVLLNGSGGKAGTNPEGILAKALTLFVTKPQSWPRPDPPDYSEWQQLAGAYVDKYGALGAVTVTYDAPDGGTPALSVKAPRLNVNGAMGPGYENDDWSLPNGEEAHFYKNDGGVYDRMVTRAGVANRQ